MTRHFDPGPVPSQLNADGLSNEDADLLLAEMLALQDLDLVECAINAGNWHVFERQSKNPFYYKRAAKHKRHSVDEQAAAFRRYVWRFVHYSPITRAKAQEKEVKNAV